MERRRNQALRQQNAGVPTRAAYYEDHAKPAWVSAPFMAVAAAAFLIAGHLLNRRPGVFSIGFQGVFLAHVTEISLAAVKAVVATWHCHA